MSYASFIQSLPQKLTQPTGIAVMASIGIHAVAGLALPFFANSSPDKAGSPQTVQLVELTPTELSRVPELTPQPLPPSAFAPTPLTSAFPPLDRAKPPSSSSTLPSGGRRSVSNMDLLRQQLLRQQVAQRRQAKRPSMSIQDAPVRVQQRQRSPVTPKPVFETSNRTLRPHSTVRIPRTSVGETLVGIKPDTNFPALEGNTTTNQPTNKPNSNQPQANNPSPDQTETNNPNSNQPQVNNPSPDQTETNNPNSNQPQANNPNSNQPQANNPNSNQPQASNSSEDTQKPSGRDETGMSQREAVERLQAQLRAAQDNRGNSSSEPIVKAPRTISINYPQGMECPNPEPQAAGVSVTVNPGGKIVANVNQSTGYAPLNQEAERAARGQIPQADVSQPTIYQFRVNINQESCRPASNSSSSAEG